MSLALKPSIGPACEMIEALALGQAFGDVEHHHVAQFLESDEMGERAADLSAADQGDFLARHGKILCCEEWKTGALPSLWQASEQDDKARQPGKVSRMVFRAASEAIAKRPE